MKSDTFNCQSSSFFFFSRIKNVLLFEQILQDCAAFTNSYTKNINCFYMSTVIPILI